MVCLRTLLWNPESFRSEESPLYVNIIAVDYVHFVNAICGYGNECEKKHIFNVWFRRLNWQAQFSRIIA